MLIDWISLASLEPTPMPLSRRSFALCWMAVGAAALAAGLGGWNVLHRAANPVEAGAALLRVDLPRPLLGEAVSEEDNRRRLETHRRTLAHLVLSPNVVAGAAQSEQVRGLPRLAGKADPVGWLAGMLHVDEVSEHILAVSMPGESRDVQAKVVNAVVEEFLSNQAIWEGGMWKSRRDLAGVVLTQYRQDLAIKRRALREDTADAERQAALRDDIGVLEELARLMAMEAERIRLIQQGPESVQLICRSRP